MLKILHFLYSSQRGREHTQQSFNSVYSGHMSAYRCLQ